MKIEKKIWPEFFQAILEGKKNFDARLADWRISQGDILVLQEWDPKRKEYTGREIEKEVVYVLKTKDLDFFTKEEVEKYGWQILGFK